MKVTVIGTGYDGLVTGACLSGVGIEVTCVDIDQKKIDGLKNGILPIYEPGLKEIVERNYSKGCMIFSTVLSEAIQGSETVFIAVGTPPGEDGSADLSHVVAVAGQIGKTMNDYLLVITKSTVPVGTAEKVRDAVANALDHRDAEFGIDEASNPEFLKEGSAIDDFMKPDRIVVGVDSDDAREILEKLYRPFILNGYPVIFMDIPSAEMTKYAANAMLATRISNMNDGRVLPAFIGHALRDEDLTIFADGSQTRSFCYVDDLIEGIYRLLMSDHAEPVNIGNPNEITISDFADEIIKLTGTTKKVAYQPLPVNDPMQRQPNISKAKSLLDWEPKVMRDEGLKRTYEWFKSLPEERLHRKAHRQFKEYTRDV